MYKLHSTCTNGYNLAGAESVNINIMKLKIQCILLHFLVNVNKYCAKRHLLCKINNIMASYSINYIPGIQSVVFY